MLRNILKVKGRKAKKPKKKKNVQLFLGNEGWMELFCAVSASGYFIPPMLVYPRFRIYSEFIKVYLVLFIYSSSKSGLINELFFMGFCILKTVINYITTFYEIHFSHRICNYCKCFGIIVGYFLPHNSRHLQPHSVKCKGALIAVLTGGVIFPWKEVHVEISCITV
jgi:hypothetical protein